MKAKGEISADNTKIHEGLMQPTDQSVGVYNSNANKVYFLTTTGISIYNMNAVEEKTIEDVINDANEKGICLIDDKLIDFKDKKEYLYNRVKDVKFSEFQKLYDGTYTNNGVVLFMDTQTDDLTLYASQDNATAAYRPYFTVTYIPK